MATTDFADAEEWSIVDFCSHFGVDVTTVHGWISDPSKARDAGIKVEGDGRWVVLAMPPPRGMGLRPIADSST